MEPFLWWRVFLSGRLSREHSPSMVPLGLSEDRVPPLLRVWGQPPWVPTGQPARTERAEPGVGVRKLKDLVLRGRALPSLGRGSGGHPGGVGRRGAELPGTGQGSDDPWGGKEGADTGEAMGRDRGRGGMPAVRGETPRGGCRRLALQDKLARTGSRGWQRGGPRRKEGAASSPLGVWKTRRRAAS